MSNLSEPILVSESERWLVVAKPAGWLSVSPANADARPVLVDWLRKRGGEVFPIHRLDVETSGVIVFARDREAHREANLWFQNRQVRKSYQLLASGHLATPMFRASEPVAGQPATTQVELQERFSNAFLALATPRTGRRHQIRIHLAAKGHPLLGDPTYGGPRAFTLPGGGALEFNRVALHARRIEFPTGEAYEASWPADFAGWVDALRAAAAALGAGGSA